MTDLEDEARLLARYLVGRDPGGEVVERYTRGHARLLARPADSADEALVGFVRRHPATLGLLEAACGVLRPHGLLRRKLTVMAAVLEATPDFADEFLPRESGRMGFAATIALHSVRAALKLVLGLALYPVARRP